MTGKRACPPEDVGGIRGYAAVAEWVDSGYDDTLVPEQFDDAHQARDWLPADWHPAEFDIEQARADINRRPDRCASGCGVRVCSRPPPFLRVACFFSWETARLEKRPWIGDALRSVTALLPASWSVAERGDGQTGRRRVDAGMDLSAPNGDKVSFVVEAKRSGSVPSALLLPALRELDQQAGSPVLFLSDYIGPSLRAALADEGISFADATGWVRIFTDRPLILLTGQGADRPRGPVRPAPSRASTG